MSSTEIDQILEAFLDVDELRRLAQRDDATESSLIALYRRGTHFDQCNAVGHPNAGATLTALGLRHRHRNVRGRIARSSRITAEQLTALVTDRSHEVRLAVACHPHTPVEQRDRLAFDRDRRVVEAAIEHGISPKVVDRLSRPVGTKQLSHWDRAFVLTVLARRPGLLAQQAERLAKNPSSWVRAAIGETTTHLHLLPELAADPMPSVVISTTDNPLADPEVMLIAAKHPHLAVHRHLVTKEHLPLPVVELLTRHPDACIRRDIAYRHARAEQLTLLADARDIMVRCAVASSPNAPTDILIRYLDDRAPSVQYRVANRDHLPLPVLERAVTHRDPAIRRSADRQHSIIQRRPIDAADVSPGAFAWADRCTDLDEVVETVRAVALHPRIAAAVLERQELDPAVAEGLLRHPDPSVRATAAARHEGDPTPVIPLLTDPIAVVRRAAFERVPHDPVLAEQLSLNPRAAVRRSLAEGWELDTKVLHRLDDDPKPSVHAAAREQLRDRRIRRRPKARRRYA